MISFVIKFTYTVSIVIKTAFPNLQVHTAVLMAGTQCLPILKRNVSYFEMDLPWKRKKAEEFVGKKRPSPSFILLRFLALSLIAPKRKETGKGQDQKRIGRVQPREGSSGDLGPGA